MIQNLFDPNWIKIVYGNTASISIDLRNPETGEDITLSENDKVIFTVKSKRGAKVIEKFLTVANFDPEDPTKLICEISDKETRLLTGEYFYDCLYVSASGQITTFISSIFQIWHAVGVYNGEPGPTPPSPTNKYRIYVGTDGKVYVGTDGKVYANKIEEG